MVVDENEVIDGEESGVSGPHHRLTIRAANSADVSGIGQVSAASGQSGAESGADAAYVEMLLRTATVRVVAEPSTSTVIAWGAVRSAPLGSLLTDLFVHPDRQRSGVGGMLLRKLWPERTAPARFTFSSQDPSALPLYAHAGLQPSWPLLYLTGPRARLSTPSMHVEQVDPAVACDVDSQLAGGCRPADYTFWTGRGSGQAVVVRDGDRIAAAGVLRGGNLVHLTSNEPYANAALTAALCASRAAIVAVCLPGPHPSLTPLLRAGFRIVDYDLAMSTPELSLPTAWAYSPALA